MSYQRSPESARIMFGMGMNEVLIILAIAVIVIGPKQLPQVARAMGKMVAQFKRATNDLRATISEEVHEHIPMDDINEFKSTLESGVRDVEDRSRSMMEEEFEGENKIGGEVADSFKAAIEDMPTRGEVFSPGNGGDGKRARKPRKAIAAKPVRKSNSVAAAGKNKPAAKKATSGKAAGKNAAPPRRPAKTAAAKSAGKGSERARPGGRA